MGKLPGWLQDCMVFRHAVLFFVAGRRGILQ